MTVNKELKKIKVIFNKHNRLKILEIKSVQFGYKRKQKIKKTIQLFAASIAGLGALSKSCLLLVTSH